MNDFKTWLKQTWCAHRNWSFVGHNGPDKESRHHCHLEECDNCEKVREVVNNYSIDDCGRFASRP